MDQPAERLDMDRWIGSFVRHGLTALGGALVAVGVAEPDAAQFVDATAPIVTGVLVYAVGQVWSLAQKEVFKHL